MFNEQLKIITNLEIKKYNYKTKKVRYIRVHNITTNVGLNQIRDALAGDSVTFPTHLAVGTGTTAETTGDTALETEQFRDTLTSKNKTATGQVQYKYFLGSGDANGHDISETGLFNAGSNGDMLARATFEPDEKTASEGWTFIWTVTIAIS